MNRRLLTLDDLYSYYSSTFTSSHFSSKDTNSAIVVQVDGKLNFEENSDTEGLLPVVLQSCHIGKNLNGSNIKREVMEKALPSFKNRPILGYIHEVDGQYEFYGHNMHLDENDNVVYDEIPVGIVPESCDAHLEYDEEKDKTYCVINGYIYEEYTKAADIMRREKECAVSVELCVREMSYDAKAKHLDIEDFVFTGVTILGKNENGEVVKPGMANSNIKLYDFSSENNVFSNSEINEKLIDTLEKLNATLEGFNIKNTDGKEEGIAMVNENFETEVVEAEEVAEVEEVMEAEEATVVEEETTVEETVVEEMTEETPEETVVEVSEEMSEEIVEESEEVEEVKEYSKTFEVKFEISHDEIRYALYNLLGQFEEEDNDWYFIRGVYDSYFVMQSWCSNTIYGCKYTKDGDNVALEGSRWVLHEELLTDSEKAALDEMRSNYSAIQTKLNAYEKAELDAQKAGVFEDASYAEYLEDEEFKTLIASKDKYSVEELKDKAEIAFAKCVKKAGTFAAKNPEQKTKKHGLFAFEVQEEKKPYGTLFD